jgi:tetratricopeptide (TPR) repeat protein
MKRVTVSALLILVIGYFLSGCAIMPDMAKEADRLYTTYMNAAQTQIAQKHYAQAKRDYALALTVKPNDPTAQAALRRTEARLSKLAAAAYQQGLQLERQGKYDESRDRFLTALRLNPGSPDPLKKLEAHERIAAEGYVVHAIQPGETLAALADKYYGDKYQFGLIAKFNQITDATQIRVGQAIKLPHLDNLPFHAGSGEVEIALTEQGMEAGDESDAAEDIADQASIYMDQGLSLFKQKQYEEAAFEFSKVLNTKPDDPGAKRHLAQCYLQQGSLAFHRKSFMDAKGLFERCLSFDPSCQECRSAVDKSIDAYKDQHYRQGISFFEKENPRSAIAEWRLVQAVDANYKLVSDLIKKAETILKNLEVLKRRQ